MAYFVLTDRQQVDTTDHFAPCAWGGGGCNDISMAFPGMLQASGSGGSILAPFGLFYMPQSYTFPGSDITDTTSDVAVGGFPGKLMWEFVYTFPGSGWHH